MQNLNQTSRLYLQAGLSVLPANMQLKFAALSQWKEYQKRLPTEAELSAWFGRSQSGLCIVSGAVSGNLEMIDFDLKAELFDTWQQMVSEQSPELSNQLVVETSQSGGRHVIYRCQSEVSKNLKLAQRKVPAPSGDEVVIGGKTYKPRQDKDGSWYVIVTLIETRGQGGLFLCAPTPGYELVQGDLTQIPILTLEQRDLLLEAAWALNEFMPESADAQPPGPTSQLRPGDDYNARGDAKAILQSHGWTCVKGGENEYWRRPGKTLGWSATLKNGVFYVWSSNAHPFDAEKPYSPFGVYTVLEHSGDFSQAAKALAEQGYGSKMIEPVDSDVDLSRFLVLPDKTKQNAVVFTDPGPVPLELLRIPGLISQVIDFCMDISAYPNQAMAFCGALALQSFLCGRKVREKGDLRTNIYLLALAGASTGKDYPRKINSWVITQLGKADCLGDKFASGEGLQDAMYQTPNMLFQNDEIDSILQSFNKSRDGRMESVLSTALTMFTSSNSVYPMRRKAGKQQAGFVDQPHLTLFGTATPKYYYSALSERMLTNGFVARLITIDVGKRSTGKDAGLVDSMPQGILQTAHWWNDFNPGHPRNLTDVHPVPAVVDYTEEAKKHLDGFRTFADIEYAKAEDRNDEVSKTVWGRANENARKLALLYACSENHQSPLIGVNAAKWAIDLMTHQLRRMLFLVQCYACENEFHGLCLKVKEKLRAAKRKQMPRSELLKNMRVDKDLFNKIIDTLIEQDDLAIVASESSTRKGIIYVLCE